MAAPAFPLRINVELTNYCNQRCVLCPRLGLTRPLGFMDAALFERIAGECGRHPTALWLHFLGESLLHPGATELIRVAKAAGVRQVGLSTNGVSLAAMTDDLLASGLDRLECSMDAADREHYRALRGRDHFARVNAAVEGLLARKRELGLARPITSIQFMRTPAVERALPALVARWRPLLGPGDFVMTIEPASFVGAIPIHPRRNEVGRRGPCAWLEHALVIHQDGRVAMCGADWDAQAPLGNVRDASIADLWNGAELARRRRAHREGRFDAVPLCGSCSDWHLADGSGYRNALAEVSAVETACTA